MKSKMIFLTEMSGHHIEYFNHIYNEAIKNVETNYIFAIPESFTNISDKFVWVKSNNISFDFIDDSLIRKLSYNKIVKSFQLNKLLKKTVKSYEVNDIFLIDLMMFMPFLPFFFSSKFNISGIIYQIYLYRWKQNSVFQKLIDVIKYLFFVNFSCFYIIFILNDNVAYRYLNKVYNTNKFKYLCDPIVLISLTELENLRNKLCLKKEEQVILHFGAMTDTKGTMIIFDFIKNLSKEELNNFVFIFAGVVKNDIKELFYNAFFELEKKVKILVYDDFLEFNFIASLFLASDVILCPYKRVYQSSGVIGYACQFNKPVIVPSQGFLGKLVKNNKLGMTCRKFDNSNLLPLLSKVSEFRINSNYLQNHTVEEFSKTIICFFNKTE